MISAHGCRNRLDNSRLCAAAGEKDAHCERLAIKIGAEIAIVLTVGIAATRTVAHILVLMMAAISCTLKRRCSDGQAALSPLYDRRGGTCDNGSRDGTALGRAVGFLNGSNAKAGTAVKTVALRCAQELSRGDNRLGCFTATRNRDES